MAKADGSYIINTKLNTDDIKAGLDNVEKQFDNLANYATKIGTAIASAFAIDKVVDFGKEALSKASDLQEVQNVVDVTFTTMSDKVNQFAKDAAASAGLSETMAKEYAGTFGTMAKSMGFAEAEAYELATALTQFTGDLASFRNLSQDEAFTKLQAIFTGETESLKALGVVMTQTNLDAFALANGFGKTTDAMTEQEKVSLRYQYVMDQLSAAQGDYARTSDSWANQSRNFQLQVENLMTTVGSGLIELLTPALQTLNDDILPKLIKMAGDVSETLTKIGEWIAEHEPLIKGITGTVAAFAAAWVVTDMLTWITNAGGVITMLSQMATALYTATAAKLADKAADIALIALYAVDYVQAFGALISQVTASTAAWVAKTAATVAATAAEWAQIAATTAWNAICATATALTTAFGAAMSLLTSPVFLVVMAVGALVTAIALLVKHWDTVKDAAEKAWEKIKATWDAVAVWFDQNVVQPIVGFFTQLWDDIKQGAQAAWDRIVEIWNKVASWFDQNIIQPVSDFFVGMWDNLTQGAENAWNGIKAVWGSVVDWFREKIIDPVKEAFSDVYDFVSGIWNGIVDFIKDSVNSIIGAINGMIDGVVSGMNAVINGLNTLSIDIPEWVPAFGGEKFGFNIPLITAPQIPYLAEGAVIPPRSPFLAIVGDQTSGTNVEAPLATIQEALRNELESTGFQVGDINIEFTGDLAGLISFLTPKITIEQRRNSRAGGG